MASLLGWPALEAVPLLREVAVGHVAILDIEFVDLLIDGTAVYEAVIEVLAPPLEGDLAIGPHAADYAVHLLDGVLGDVDLVGLLVLGLAVDLVGDEDFDGLEIHNWFGLVTG